MVPGRQRERTPYLTSKTSQAAKGTQSRWLIDKASACQYRRPGINPQVRKIPWRRKEQPTLVLLPGKSHRQRSLVGYSPQGWKKSWARLTTKQQRPSLRGKRYGSIVQTKTIEAMVESVQEECPALLHHGGHTGMQAASTHNALHDPRIVLSTHPSAASKSVIQQLDFQQKKQVEHGI